MPRLGVLGTLVWDTIRARGTDQVVDEIQDWGGIAYSLAAFEAVSPAGWTQLPMIKVGSDLRKEADRYMAVLRTVDGRGLRTVDAATQRVTLYYENQQRLCEHLSGELPEWTLAELEPMVETCDALYVNFIAGWEMSLDTARRLRRTFSGPMYVDVHSLLLAVESDGLRRLRPLPEWKQWLACFDVVQVNEDELLMLSASEVCWQDAVRTVAGELVTAAGVGWPTTLLVTLGPGGAAWASWGSSGGAIRLTNPPATAGEMCRGFVDSPDEQAGDPTGCGDVWGMSCWASLLSGATLEDSMADANVLAARNVGFQGTTHLAERLRGA